MEKIKTDCAMFVCDNAQVGCSGLKRLYCKQGGCSFYKSKKDGWYRSKNMGENGFIYRKEEA